MDKTDRVNLINFPYPCQHRNKPKCSTTDGRILWPVSLERLCFIKQRMKLTLLYLATVCCYHNFPGSRIPLFCNTWRRIPYKCSDHQRRRQTNFHLGPCLPLNIQDTVVILRTTPSDTQKLCTLLTQCTHVFQMILSIVLYCGRIPAANFLGCTAAEGLLYKPWSLVIPTCTARWLHQRP